MKKIISYISVFILSFIFVGIVKAESINSIKMDIYVDNSGNAHVTEIWDTNATEKTEYYHAYYNIGNSSITDLKVKNEEKDFEEIAWDTSASLSDKAYKYGYNYTNNGVEICFGKSSYKSHTYTLTYTITNFVSNTSDDKQIIYWNLLDSIKPAPGNVEIVIYADEAFLDTLPVWGYGNYGGLAYVYDGKIYVSNDHLSTSDYMVLLAEFEAGTFDTTNTLDKSFDDYLDMAEEGSTHYVEKKSIFNTIGEIISVLFTPLMFLFFIIIASISGKNTYGGGTYNLDFGKDNRKIPKDNNMFRDIPCNKDIYRAYWVATHYSLIKKKTDFLGTILLKWHKEGVVKIESKTKGKVFKKEDSVVVFNNSELNSPIELENKLYSYMYEASKDGILESKEFEKWCGNHYSKILNWFDKVLDYETDKLVEEGKITKENKQSFKVFNKTVYVVNPSMLEEAKQMDGLKKFFNEFDNMSDKEAIEVMLWEEYLMYAQIFGVAKKVAKQFKKLYPDVITDYDYETVLFFDTMTYSSIASANSAKSRAEAYSSGGGGFSSGGGGGGSFGGGGGGSR